MSDTLTNLRTRARQRADMTSTQFVTDAELTSYVNSASAELYAALVAANQDWFTPDPETLTITSGNTIALSGLALKMARFRGVDYAQGSRWLPLRAFTFGDREWYQNTGLSAVGSYRIWYVPEMTKLGADADQLHAAIPADLEDFVVVGAALRMRDKEETGTTDLRDELTRIQKRIASYSSTRGQSKHISDNDGSADDCGRVYRLSGVKLHIHTLGNYA